MSHPRHGLHDALLNPVRLSVTAFLNGVEKAEFATVRDAVEISDSALSKQAGHLETEGIVKVTKGYVGRRPRTWLSLTDPGRRAFADHLAALRAIAGD